MTPYYQDDAVTIYHGDCMSERRDCCASYEGDPHRPRCKWAVELKAIDASLSRYALLLRVYSAVKRGTYGRRKDLGGSV